MEPDASSTVAVRWQHEDPRMVLFQPVFHFPSRQVPGRSPSRRGWLEPGRRRPTPCSKLSIAGLGTQGALAYSRGPERTCTRHVKGVQVGSVVAVPAHTVGRPLRGGPAVDGTVRAGLVPLVGLEGSRWATWEKRQGESGESR